MFRKRNLFSVLMIVVLVLSLSPARNIEADANADTSSYKTTTGQTQDADPIPGYLSQVSEANLTDYVTALVGYGPRLVNEFKVYTDAACNYGATVYDVNNLDRAANYAKGVFDAMGYTAVLEEVPGYGHNVVVTKIGTVYPNTYIEFGAHFDTKPGSPGAIDNGSGSAAVMELARVLKDYPSRYSMTFALWVGEETGGFAGSYHHIDAMLAAGKQIKVGLNLDSPGQLGAGDIYRNDIWTHNANDLQILDIMTQVNTQYGLGLTLVNNDTPCAACSDHYAYWTRGLTAVASMGGWTPASPSWHQCFDVVAGNFNSTAAAKITKQNLATALKLDQDFIPPTVTLALSSYTVPANGSSTVIATATVKDNNNNPLTSETVIFSTSGDVSISAVTNHGDGTYSVTVTASTTTGSETITATDGGVSASAILVETTYCPGTCFTDTAVIDFNGGTTGANTYIAATTDGEVILAPTVGTEFSGSSIPAGWSVSPWGGGSQSVSYAGGWATIASAQLKTDLLFGPGRSIEFVANFGGGQWQLGGFCNTASTAWAGFHFNQTGSTLTADENNTYVTNIPGSWAGTAHRYRIDWNVAPNAGDIVYYIDGVEVVRHAHSETAPMGPMFTDYTDGGPINQVDWVRMSPYASSGTFYSRIFDAGGPAVWGIATWTAETPSGTTILLSVRSGNTTTPDGTWSGFSPITNGASIGASAQYVQYQAVLSTSNSSLTPALNEISLRYTPGTVGLPEKLGFVIQPGGAIAGSPFTTQPVVAVQDASGYTVISDNSTQVTLGIGTNPAGGVLTCSSNPVTVVNGVATFAGCRIDKLGTGYTLVASGGSLTDATSASFNVTLVPPGSITLTLAPNTIPANGAATAIATATVKDGSGNPLIGATVTFSTSGDVTFNYVTDNSDGTYSVTMTASTTPGDETITATASPVSASAILHETANCPGTCFTDTAVTDFSGGTTGAYTYIAATTDGEVILAPTVGTEFSGSTLPTGWSVFPWGPGTPTPSVAFTGGWATIDSARLRTDLLFGPGRSIEFAAILGGGMYQALGFDVTGTSSPWAVFHYKDDGATLEANENNTYVTNIPDSWVGTPHRYRIDWNVAPSAGDIVYYIDGVEVVRHTRSEPGPMAPVFTDYTAGGPMNRVDWIRMTPYASSGTFLSRILDGGGPATSWGIASWTAETPAATSIALSVRSGNTPTPDGSWNGFSPITNGSSINVHAQYLQYQAVLSTSNLQVTPALKDICISYVDTTPPTIVTRSPAPGATGVAVNATISIGFSEQMLASTITNSTIRLRVSGAPSDVEATVSYAGTTATLTPNAALSSAILYQVTVEGSVSDLSGNAMGGNVTWTFTTATPSLTDSTVADFSAGTPGSCTYVAKTDDGEVILTPAFGDEFYGPNLDLLKWLVNSYAGGSPSATVSGGWVTVDSAKVRSITLFTAGRTIEFNAIMNGGQYQNLGLHVNGTNPPVAVFDYNDGANYLIKLNALAIEVGGPTYSFPVGDTWHGSAHRYRIDWTGSSMVYYIDGIWKASTPTGITSSMGAFMGDYMNDALKLQVDWVRMSPYASSGTFLSRIFDAGQTVQWTDLSHTATLPTGTTLTFETRTSLDNITWTNWQVVNSPIASPNGRYLQYRAMLTTSDPNVTPTLENVTISYSNSPTAVIISSFTGKSHLSTVQLDWETASEVGLVGFNIYRSDSLDGVRQKLNTNLLPTRNPGQMIGATYQYNDKVDQGQHYYYWLDLVLTEGTELTAPVVLDTNYWALLPAIVR